MGVVSVQRSLWRVFVLAASLILALPAQGAFAWEKSLPTDREVTLEECTAFVLGTHPRIKGAEQDEIAGKYRVKETQAAYWPFVNFQANAAYQHSSGARVGNAVVSNPSDIRTAAMAFNLNWILFDFGRTYFNVQTQKKLEDALAYDLATAQNSVTYDVRDAYFNVLRSQTLLRVAHATLDQANSHLKQAQAFYEVGTRPKFDVTSAEVEVNDATLQVIQAEDAIKTSMVTLTTRLGIDPLTELKVQDRPELEKMDYPLADYLELAMKNLPNLQALYERLNAAEMTVKQAYSDFLPSLSSSATANWFKEEHSPTVDTQLVQVTVDVPIFEGFRRTARLGETKAAALSAKYRIEDAKNDVALVVGQAYTRAVDARTRTVTLVASVTKAKENLDIAQGRYEAGVAQIIEVTDAQTSLTTAETNLAQANFDYHLAYSTLLRAIGAGTQVQGVAK